MIFSLGYNNARALGEAPAFGSIVYVALHGTLIVLSLAVCLILGRPLLREFMEAVGRRRITVEALFVLSASGALAGSLVSTLAGSGSIYYEVVAIVLCVYAIGKQIGALQKGRVGDAVAALRHSFDTARVRANGEGPHEIPVADLRPEHVVLVGPGEPIPIDGSVMDGNGYVRETPLTGEPSPVPRHPGDPVLAGTWSVDGNFAIQPDLSRARRLDPILEVIDEAPRAPSRLQETADRLMQVFVPLVSSVSGATFTGWLIFADVPWWEALFNAMAVLLVACPCALGLAMPTGIWAALFHLGQRGIIGRHGYLLDTLSGCTTVIFDKTGTLTRFEPVCECHFPGLGEAEEGRLCDEVASLCGTSPHPVSKAIATLSKASLPVGDFGLHPGLGLSGRVGAAHLLVGEPNLLEMHGIPLRGSHTGYSGKPVHIARNGRHLGWLLLREELRDSAMPTLESLRKLGCGLVILSGDPSSVPEIGTVPVEGGLSPEDKAQRVRALSDAGERVLFVGDGINDVPAMEASMGALAIDLGSALATEFADGVLIGGEVAALPTAIRKARHLHHHLRGNLLFALSYNVVGMALAAAGLLHPVVAALLMVGSSLVVSLRALRAAAAWG